MQQVFFFCIVATLKDIGIKDTIKAFGDFKNSRKEYEVMFFDM